MGWVQVVLLIYGILNIALGIHGFVGAKSIWSLVAGGIAGIIVIGAAALSKTHPHIGYGISIVIGLLLIGRFMGPLIAKHQIYPAGVEVIASVIIVICAVLGYLGKG